MKRYLLFAGEEHEEEGGIKDFKGDFDSIVDAEKRVKKEESIGGAKFDWWHIVDRQSFEIVKGGE